MSNRAVADEGRLSKPEHWEGAASAVDGQDLRFDPLAPGYRDIHALMKGLLSGTTGRVLEIGCYPGRFLWYFNKFFGYKTCGLEYVPSLASKARENLQQTGVVDAEVVEGDFFSDAVLSKVGLFDVVCSFGFVEHFEDTEAVVDRHLKCVRPGGLVVIIVPNHSGIYGQIMKWADKSRYEMHNCMGYDTFINNLPDPTKCEVVEGGYYGRVGFWNCWLYQVASNWGRIGYLMVRIPGWVIERLGRFIPNSRFLSPEIGIVLRRL